MGGPHCWLAWQEMPRCQDLDAWKMQKSSFNWGWKVAVHQFKSLRVLGLVWRLLWNVFLSDAVNLHLSKISGLFLFNLWLISHLLMGQGSSKSWYATVHSNNLQKPVTHQPIHLHHRGLRRSCILSIPRACNKHRKLRFHHPILTDGVIEAEAPGVDVAGKKNDLHFALIWYKCWFGSLPKRTPQQHIIQKPWLSEYSLFSCNQKGNPEVNFFHSLCVSAVILVSSLSSPSYHCKTPLQVTGAVHVIPYWNHESTTPLPKNPSI